MLREANKIDKDVHLTSKKAIRDELGMILTAMINAGNCSSEEIILLGAYFGANVILETSQNSKSVTQQEVLHEVYMAYNEIYPSKFTLSDMQKIRVKILELLKKDRDSLRSYIQNVIISYVLIK
jgi:hypothetical protein